MGGGLLLRQGNGGGRMVCTRFSSFLEGAARAREVLEVAGGDMGAELGLINGSMLLHPFMVSLDVSGIGGIQFLFHSGERRQG
jgi:hypothetical protein